MTKHIPQAYSSQRFTAYISEGYDSRVLERLGSELRLARKKTGLRQEDVARKLGVTQPTVSGWEKGEGIQIETLFELAALYRTSIVDFVTGVNPAYDLLGLPSRVIPSGTDGGTKEKGGASDVIPASAQARIRELQQELADLKAAVRQRALDLTELTTDESRLRAAGTHSASRSRKGRSSR